MEALKMQDLPLQDWPSTEQTMHD